MTDRPNYVAADGSLQPLTDAMFALWQADTAAAASAPPPVPTTISRRQFATQLAVQGDITWDECLAFLGAGTLPQLLSNAIAQIPVDSDPNAQNKAKAAVIGATAFDRANPTTVALITLAGKNSAQADALWTAAAAIG